MATKTATCVANGLIFQDPFGISHTVTTSQTFTFDLTDGGEAAVAYRQNVATSVTTTDGRRLTFRPKSIISQVGGTDFNGPIRTWGPTADAQDAVAVLSLRGEFVTEFSEGGIEQRWVAETLTVDNVDAPTTMTGRFKDQYGRFMDWDGITVA
jgi:hypothetical protein